MKTLTSRIHASTPSEVITKAPSSPQIVAIKPTTASHVGKTRDDSASTEAARVIAAAANSDITKNPYHSDIARRAVSGSTSNGSLISAATSSSVRLPLSW